MTSFNSNLDKVEELLSKSQVDIETPKTILAKVAKGVRSHVLSAVAQASDIPVAFKKQSELAEDILKKGDVFPIIIKVSTFSHAEKCKIKMSNKTR